MSKQQTKLWGYMHVQRIVWGRLILVTALLLSGEALVAMTFSRTVYADCVAGNGGNGGVAIGGSMGADGGSGGDCVFGSKGGEGGTSQGSGANGGNIVVAGSTAAPSGRTIIVHSSQTSAKAQKKANVSLHRNRKSGGAKKRSSH